MPKVTVLMPTLNVVKYIDACMKSVLSQTMQDIEVIVIDAGSNDGTMEILKSYASTDERIKLVHSDIKSYGYQINMGLILAQGEYISIVETDDIIVSDMYEVLYETAVRTKAQYVKGTFQKFIEISPEIYWYDNMGIIINDAKLFGKVIEPRYMPELLVSDIYLWTGIYRRDFLHNVRLNETVGAAFQDQGFLFQTISSATRAVYLNKVVYWYRQDNSNSSVINRKGFRYIKEEYAYIGKFLPARGVKWVNAYYVRMLNQCIGRFEMMALSGAFWYEAVPDMEILRQKLLDAVRTGSLLTSQIPDLKRHLLQMYLNGAETIYSHIASEFNSKIASIHKLFQNVEAQQTLIFGGGKCGRFVHAMLERKYPGSVLAYCDNNAKLWNTQIQGLSVLSPQAAIEKYSAALYVIANLNYTDTIQNQLINMGVSPYKIYIYSGAIDARLFRIIEE